MLPLLLLLLLCSAAHALMRCPAGYTTKLARTDSYRFGVLCCVNGPGGGDGIPYCEVPDPGDYTIYCDEMFPTLKGICSCLHFCGGTVQPDKTCAPTPDACLCGSEQCCRYGAPCNSSAPTPVPTAPPTPAPTGAPTAPTAAPSPVPTASPTPPTAAQTSGAPVQSAHFALALAAVFLSLSLLM